MTTFQALLRARGYTLLRFSKEMGVSRQTVSAWSNGKVAPRPATIYKIAEKTNISKEILFDLFYKEK